MHRSPVHSTCCILPGASSCLNLAGKSAALNGMWKSPMHSASTMLKPFSCEEGCSLCVDRATVRPRVMEVYAKSGAARRGEGGGSERADFMVQI
jgi:hypothetical protein